MQPTFYSALTAIGNRSASIFDLSTGEPVIPRVVTDTLAETASKVASHPKFAHWVSSYSNLDGDPEFLRFVADRLGQKIGRIIDKDELLVVPGCQFALNLIRSIGQLDNRPLYWPSPFEFPGAVFGSAADMGARPFIRTRKARGIFGVNLDLPNRPFANRCMVILSNPHSPTGTLWPAETLSRLADACLSADGWLVLDETYAFPWAPLSDRAISYLDHPNVLHLISFSKVGLAGERLGFVFGPKECIIAMRGALRRQIIQSPKLVQILGSRLIELFENNLELGASFGKFYSANWRTAAEILLGQTNLPGARIAEWEGGPFLWFEWDEVGPDDYAIFQTALVGGVAVMPGSVLKTPDTDDRTRALRVGLGVSKEVLVASLERLVTALRI
jgi:DNA-binding transcriptional MocR family regulator